MSTRSLTIFTCPRSFADPDIARLQRNAIQSWLALGPSVQVVLLSEEAGLEAIAGELGCRHSASLERAASGAPWVSSVFAEAERVAPADWFAYVNADTLLDDTFCQALERCSGLPQFLLIGQGVNGEVLRRSGSIGPSIRLDYLAFPRGLWSRIPPVALEGDVWHDRLLREAWSAGMMIVDGTADVTARHQDDALGVREKKYAGERQSGTEAEEPRLQAGAIPFDVLDSTHVLARGRGRVAMTQPHVLRRMDRLREFRPRIWNLLRSPMLRRLFCTLQPWLPFKRVTWLDTADGTKPGGAANPYDADYYAKQRKVGILGGRANLFKFEEHVRASDVVLDFGCGGGFLLKELACARRIGVEINPHAREEAARNGVEVFATLDGVPDGALDVCISNHALEHVEDPLGVLRMLRAKLKPGGRCVFVTPFEHQPSSWSANDESHHLFTWSPLHLGNLFQRAGYEVMSVECLRHAWMPEFGSVIETKGWAAFHRRAQAHARKTGAIQVRIVARYAATTPA